MDAGVFKTQAMPEGTGCTDTSFYTAWIPPLFDPRKKIRTLNHGKLRFSPSVTVHQFKLRGFFISNSKKLVFVVR